MEDADCGEDSEYPLIDLSSLKALESFHISASMTTRFSHLDSQTLPHLKSLRLVQNGALDADAEVIPPEIIPQLSEITLDSMNTNLVR